MHNPNAYDMTKKLTNERISSNSSIINGKG